MSSHSLQLSGGFDYMPKIFKRHCNYCKKFYKGQGIKYCSGLCYHRGQDIWNKGKTGIYSEDTIKKMKKAGKKPERIKISLQNLKKINNIGRKHTKEMRIRGSEAKKGSKNPAWRGGTSFEPYGLEFNEDLKEVIRNRDRRKCQLCEKTELENKKKLTVHHIDYDKKNNNPNNLIALCGSCHQKTNFNRNYWTNYFSKNEIKNSRRN